MNHHFFKKLKAGFYSNWLIIAQHTRHEYSDCLGGMLMAGYYAECRKSNLYFGKLLDL
jgi:hypothetical protein